MRRCSCFQSPLLSRLPGQWHRRGLREEGALFDACKDQTACGTTGLLPARHALSGCCQLVLLCSGGKLCRLKTAGSSPAVCTQKESCTGQSKFTNSYLTHLVGPDMISWGNFWGWILFPAVRLFYPSLAFGRIWILTFSNATPAAMSRSTHIICIEVKHNVSCRDLLNYEAAEQSHVSRCQHVPERWLVTYGC